LTDDELETLEDLADDNEYDVEELEDLADGNEAELEDGEDDDVEDEDD
jgi:hypothetical protein